jgi:3-hydroxyisobutyrate dehydrogenase
MIESMSKPRVAILGLVIMGSGMAGRLLATGFPLTVYNRNKERTARFARDGASVADSPREAASQAELVISMVADDVASRSVWLGENGALGGVSPGSVLIESSTLSVAWVRELAAAAAERKCELLDAPVTGSKPHAAAGELLFLVGGSAAALAKARTALSVLGRDAIHLGPNGSGALLKLINNFLCGVQAASFAEAASMIRAGGLDSEKAASVLTNGAPGSPLVKAISARAAAGDSTPNFLLRLMAKDLEYAIREAARNGLSLQTAEAALEIFRRAVAQGHGDEDFSAVIKSLRQI